MKKLILSLVTLVVLPQMIISQTFSNTANVCPPDNSTTGTTSVIAVLGAGSSLTSITVNIPNISHTWYDDLDIMLISPTGQRIILMSDCGGNNSGTGNRNYTFIQGGTVLANGAAPTGSGNVSPTDYEADAAWPDGAPTITAMNQFTGDPNGNWTLRVLDDAGGDTGCLNGGWSITIVATTPSTPPSCAGSPSAPANASTGVSNNPTLSWAGVAGATGYDVYFGTATPATTLVSTNQPGTNYIPTTLTAGTTYYWRVVPRNAAGLATGCSTWSFTTCTPTGNPALYGAGSWIGYVYNSATAGAFTTYQGFVTEATVFNRTHTTASGATINHCSSNQDLFAIRYRNTTNFPAGLYTFTVGGDDGVRFSIDGGATWLINQWVDQGYTTVTSASIFLTGNTDMVFEYYENGGGSQSSFNYTFAPDPCSSIVPLSCGTVSNYSMAASTGAWNNYGGPFGVPGQEKIFSFTPTVSGAHNIVVNSSAGYVDLFWKAASIGCNTTSWTYLNDITGTETSVVTLTAGVQYYFLLDDENTTANTGSITINCPAPPAWQSSWVSTNTGSAVWCAGETRNVTVTVTNSGTNTWTNAGPDINIGVKWNGEADYFVRVNANGLTAGSTQTYTFTVTAPTTAGFNNLSFDIVNEGNFWFANNPAGVGPGNIVYVSSPIQIYSVPTVNAGSDVTSCIGTPIQLNGTASGAVAPVMISGSQTFNWTGYGYDGGFAGYLGDFVEGTTSGMPAGSVISSVTYSTNIDANALGGNGYCNNWWSSELYVNGVYSAQACDVTNVSFATLNGQPTNNQTFRLWLYDLDDFDDYAYMSLSVTINYSYPSTVPGTLTYLWSPSSGLNNSAISSPIANLSSSATYTLTASNNICSSTDQVAITVNSLPTVNAGPDKTICIGNSVTLSGAGASTYTWNNGVTNGTAFMPTATTNYTVTGTDSNGCTNTDQVVVTLPTAGTALSQDNESATCVVNQNGWVHFYHSSGRLIGSINSQGQDLGSVTATSYVEGAPVSVDACTSSNPIYATTVMGRHWVITPTHQPTSAVLVRLPYGDAEFNDLTSAASINANSNDDLLTPSDLGMTKYSNGTAANVNDVATDNCGVGTSTFHTQMGNGLATSYSSVNANYADFSIPGFSEFWLHGSSQASPLPVELLNFQANCAGEGKVDVTWATASEHNSANFKVEKSRDGMNWTVLSSVAGAGNSTQMINYAIVDNNAASGVNYYRLTQTDFDGASETFNIASANCGDNTPLTTVKVYPNPSAGDFYIDFTSEEITGASVITITDARGMAVYTQNVTVTKGSNVFHIENMKAAPGMYYIQVSNGTATSNIVKHSLR